MDNFSQESCIYAKSASSVYESLIRNVLTYGKECSPRGKKIKEIRPVMFRIDGGDRWIGHPSRKLSRPLGILEGLQMIGGFSVPTALTAVAPQYRRFINPENGELDGAYGPRVVEQIPYIIRLLRQDPDSRQAVVTIYGAKDHHTSLDIPCTLSLQFFLRDNLDPLQNPGFDKDGPPKGKALELVVTMRSNDVWLGVPYDIIQFSLLQEALAGELEVAVGMYTHIAGSMHLYKRDWARAGKILEGNDDPMIGGSPQMQRQPFQKSMEDAHMVVSSWWLERMQKSESKAETTGVVGEALEVLMKQPGLQNPNLSPFFNWCLSELREEVLGG